MAAVMEAVEQLQHLTFHLAGEEYAIGILRVKEIIEYGVVTTVPGTPQFIRGVINLRGSVVPVVDLAVKFGLPESPVTRRTCIVIVEVELEGEQTVMGVVADAVSQVVDFLPQDVEAPPAFGTKVRVDYLRGLGKLGKKFALILDIDRILSADDLRAAASLEAAVSIEAAAPAPDAGPPVPAGGEASQGGPGGAA